MIFLIFSITLSSFHGIRLCIIESFLSSRFYSFYLNCKLILHILLKFKIFDFIYSLKIFLCGFFLLVQLFLQFFIILSLCEEKISLLFKLFLFCFIQSEVRRIIVQEFYIMMGNLFLSVLRLRSTSFIII